MSPDPSSPSLTLDDSAGAPARARRFVSDLLVELNPDRAYEAVLAVSELVSNSVRHGRAPITVSVERGTTEVTISVHDVGDTLPPARPEAAPDTSPGGRGLLILQAIGTGHGVQIDPGTPGKSMWVTVATG